LAPIHNPQSSIPNPQSPFIIIFNFYSIVILSKKIPLYKMNTKKYKINEV